MADATFGLVVLGSGTVGQGPAYEAAKAGWRVAVVECGPPGGTCATRGCDAKKPFVNAAAAVAAARRLAGKGVGMGTVEGEIPGAGVHWRAAHAFKRTFTDPIPDRTRADLRKAGIELVEGEPRFVERSVVEVALHGGGTRLLRGDRFLIATGLKPRPLDIEGADLVCSSDEFLELETLPPRVLFVGGGYISMEFAHAAARVGGAGVTCTVVERGGCPLRAFDSDLVHRLMAASEAAGVHIQCDQCVTRVERSDDDTFVAVCEDTGKRFEADLVVHGAGRVPSIDGLFLDVAGVEHDMKRGVVVDRTLRSVSREDVWAGGDVAAVQFPDDGEGGDPLEGNPGQFTPIASRDAKALRGNIVRGESNRPDYRAMPSVCFTLPSLAGVGLSPDAARKAGFDVEEKRGDMSGWKYYRELGVEHAGFHTVTDRASGRLLGAAMLSPEAAVTINIFAFAIRQGMTVTDLKATLFAYPTEASGIGSMLP